MVSLSFPNHGATGWDSILNPLLQGHEDRLTTVEPLVTAATNAANAATTAAGNAAQKVNFVSRAAAYTAAPADYVYCSTGAAGYAITLPTAPADKSVVKVTWNFGSNTLTVNAGGTAKFFQAGGPTSETFTLLNEVRTYTYQASTNFWYVEYSAGSLATLDSRYAPFGASYKGIAYASGDLITAGYDLVPNGLPIVASATLTAAQITLIYPTIGGTQVWNVVLDRAGTFSTIGTITVADGARGGVVNSLSVSLLSGDLLLVQCIQANGSTYTGLGPSFRAAFGGSLTLPTAPSATTGLAATPGTTTVGLSWTKGTNSNTTLIRRDGLPYAVTANSTYTDSGPTGAGLSPGETHTYNADAMVPGAITINATGVVSGPGNSYTYYPATAQSLSALTNDWGVTLGSNSGTAAATDSSGILTLTSGAVGSGATQDKVLAQWIKDSTVAGTPPGASHTAFTRSWAFGFGTSNALVQKYWNAPTFVSLATSVANFIQLQYSPTNYRVGIKAAAFNSGVFYTLTASTTSPAQATTVGDSSGLINWPISVVFDPTKAHLYGMKVDLLPIAGDGTQQIKIYMGTTTQLTGGTLPLINTITLTAAQRSALATGCHYTTMLGSQTTAVAQTYFEQSVTIQPDI